MKEFEKGYIPPDLLEIAGMRGGQVWVNDKYQVISKDVFTRDGIPIYIKNWPVVRWGTSTHPRGQLSISVERKLHEISPSRFSAPYTYTVPLQKGVYKYWLKVEAHT